MPNGRGIKIPYTASFRTPVFMTQLKTVNLVALVIQNEQDIHVMMIRTRVPNVRLIAFYDLCMHFVTHTMCPQSNSSFSKPVVNADKISHIILFKNVNREITP